MEWDNPWAGFAVTGGKSPFPPFTQNINVPASEAIFLTPVSIFDSTTVRLKVEENQLVDVFGEIGTHLEGLKGV